MIIKLHLDPVGLAQSRIQTGTEMWSLYQSVWLWATRE